MDFVNKLICTYSPRIITTLIVHTFMMSKIYYCVFQSQGCLFYFNDAFKLMKIDFRSTS